MSSAVLSTSAASSRPFVFDDDGMPDAASDFASSNQDSRHPEPGERDLARSVSAAKPVTGVIPASRLEIRPAPEMAASGIAALDVLTGGGLPRGCLTELCGPASSGRTTVLLSALAAATRRGEFCAVVDASDALNPQSAAEAGVDLERLLWVRCGEDSEGEQRSPQRHRDTEKRTKKQFIGRHPERSHFSGEAKDLHWQEINARQEFSSGRPISCTPSAREAGNSSQSEFHFARFKSNASEHSLDQVLRATDLLLESGGFGLVALDLGDVPFEAARRIPLTTWFRFRRAVEHKPAVLLALEQQPIAGSCSSLVLKSALSSGFPVPSEAQSVPLLTGLEITLEVARCRLSNAQSFVVSSEPFGRKPMQSVSAASFVSKTAWG